MKTAFPHIGNVYVFIKALLYPFGAELVTPPPSGRRTLELGSKYSPESACLPMKINLGNFIECAEMGAEAAIITGANGPCRFGYYGEMERRILDSLGYHMKFIILDGSRGGKVFLKNLFEVFDSVNLPRIAFSFCRAALIMKKTDRLEEESRLSRATEKERGTTDAVMNEFKIRTMEAKSVSEIKRAVKDTAKKIEDIQTDTSRRPLKIGIVGDIYTIIEPATNLDIERILGNMGIIANRSLTVSSWMGEHIFALKKNGSSAVKKACRPYLGTPIGGHARESIAHTALYAQKGYDGVIQIYPLTCMPEIVATGILPQVSKDFNIPVLTLVIDEMTGEAGYRTRIEAFADMLWERRKNGQILSGN